MPITPFHFGVGIAAKAAAPRRFNLIFFIALQVIIDLESLYNLVYRRHPVHRFLHTFVGATLLAAVASGVVFGGAVLWCRRSSRRRPTPWLIARLLATALFATWSHVVLDGIMHRDARPFAPFADSNPLLGIVDLGMLHLLCVGLGLLGLIILAFRWPTTERP